MLSDGNQMATNWVKLALMSRTPSRYGRAFNKPPKQWIVNPAVEGEKADDPHRRGAFTRARAVANVTIG